MHKSVFSENRIGVERMRSSFLYIAKRLLNGSQFFFAAFDRKQRVGFQPLDQSFRRKIFGRTPLSACHNLEGRQRFVR